MNKTKQALFWGVIEFLLGISVYLQYEHILDKVDVKIFKIVLFIIIYIGIALLKGLAIYLLSKRKKVVIDKIYILSIIISSFIYLSLLCFCIYNIIKYNENILKLIVVLVLNVTITILMYIYTKRESDDNE